MKEVIEFYNKYDEDNRLKSKTHLPEYLITMKYIKSKFLRVTLVIYLLLRIILTI